MALLLAFGVSSPFSSSTRLLPARSCLRVAASFLARSRSFSFSRNSACRTDCAASALAFFDRLIGSPSESSSTVAFRRFDGGSSDVLRCRLMPCLLLPRQSASSPASAGYCTHSSLSSLARLPFLLPLSTSRLLASIAFWMASSSSSSSLLLMVPRLLPGPGSALARDAVSSRSACALSPCLLTELFRRVLPLTGW